MGWLNAFVVGQHSIGSAKAAFARMMAFASFATSMIP